MARFFNRNPAKICIALILGMLCFTFADDLHRKISRAKGESLERGRARLAWHIQDITTR